MARISRADRWKPASFWAPRDADGEILYGFEHTRDLGGGMSQTWIEEEFRSACDEWAGQTRLSFRKTQGTADLEIAWANLGKETGGNLRGGHTEHLPQSRQSRPSLRIAFSDEIAWSNRFANNHLNFRNVALHELGHAIGMGHSADESAIMYPTTNKAAGARYLAIDDKVGARYLYQLPPLEYTYRNIVSRFQTIEVPMSVILFVNETPWDFQYKIHRPR
jgi:matrix metalloproteinase-20 (enamelysin)